ncbi:hypothetical protein [Tannerella sp.]|uniref:hypothetical protein n=1 Tax=Tannerella sp. TaxID=2382127 RepID=UPI0026DD6F9E|nr:hypothetical protein [Tannerella sp.]MDO4703060.1 hypothetical protein [Tannerella sp.]
MKKILFILAITLLATGAFAARKEYKREIVKEFSVGDNPVLSIENKYGNIRIIEGTNRKITFKIEIRGEGRTEEAARKYAESVSVDFSHSGNRVSAHTKFEPINCNNCGRSVHYTVTAPKSVIPLLENKYGNIYLDNLTQPLTVELKYGNLFANAVHKATIDISYGNVTMNKCNNLSVESKYSGIKIDEAQQVVADSKYDHYRIESVTDFEIETGYTDVRIGKLNKRLTADRLRYGGLKIAEVANDFSEIRVDAAYSNVKIGLTEEHAFKAALYTNYGKIDTGNLTFHNVSLKKQGCIVGTAGKSNNPSASVNISVSYGGIVLK